MSGNTILCGRRRRVVVTRLELKTVPAVRWHNFNELPATAAAVERRAYGPGRGPADAGGTLARPGRGWATGGAPHRPGTGGGWQHTAGGRMLALDSIRNRGRERAHSGVAARGRPLRYGPRGERGAFAEGSLPTFPYRERGERRSGPAYTPEARRATGRVSSRAALPGRRTGHVGSYAEQDRDGAAQRLATERIPIDVTSPDEDLPRHRQEHQGRVRGGADARPPGTAHGEKRAFARRAVISEVDWIGPTARGPIEALGARSRPGPRAAR